MSADLAQVMRGEITHEEIAWLASFGWCAERIAGRLRLEVDTVEQHAAGRRGGAPIRLAASVTA